MRTSDRAWPFFDVEPCLDGHAVIHAVDQDVRPVVLDTVRRGGAALERAREVVVTIGLGWFRRKDRVGGMTRILILTTAVESRPVRSVRVRDQVMTTDLERVPAPIRAGLRRATSRAHRFRKAPQSRRETPPESSDHLAHARGGCLRCRG